MPDEVKLLSISQAAKHLGVSADTLRRWEKSGKIHPQRTLGNARRYRIQELDEIKANKQGPSTRELLKATKAELDEVKQHLEEQPQLAQAISPATPPVEQQLLQATQQLTQTTAAIHNFAAHIVNLIMDLRQRLPARPAPPILPPPPQEEPRWKAYFPAIVSGLVVLLLLGLAFLIAPRLLKSTLSSLTSELGKAQVPEALEQTPLDQPVDLSPEGKTQVQALSVASGKTVLDSNGNIYFSGGLTGGYIDTDTQNLITNSGFEANNSGTPVFYTYQGDATTTQAYVSQDASFEGQNTLKLEPQANDSLTIIPTYASLDSGKHYTFTAYIKALNAGKSEIAIGYGEEQETVAIEGTSSWKQIRFTKTFAETDTPSLNDFFIAVSSQGGGGAIYLDGLQLETGSLASAYRPQALGSDGLLESEGSTLAPKTANTGSLGTATKPFKDLYVSDQHIQGNLTVSKNASIGGDLTVGGDFTLNSVTAKTKVVAQTDGIYTGAGTGIKRLDANGNLTNIGSLTFTSTGSAKLTGSGGYVVAAGGLGVGGGTTYHIDNSGNAVVHGLSADGNITLGNSDDTISLSGTSVSITSNSGNDLTISAANKLVLQASDSDDYIYFKTDSDSSALYFEGVSTYTNDPGVRVNSSDGKLEYRDENSSTWVTFDSLEDTTSSLWTDSGTITYLTSTSDDLAVGGDTLTSSIFAIDESAATFYLGYDNSANPTFLFEATDGDQATFGYNTNDSFYTSGANVGIGVTDPDEILEVAGRINLQQTTAPSTTTDKLYNVGGTLYWNGTDLTAAGASLWTDGGTITYLTSTTDNLAVGGTTSAAPLFMDVSTGNLTLTGDLTVSGGGITGANSESLSLGETDNVITFTSGGATRATINASGNFGIEGSLYDITDTTLTVADHLTVTGNLTVGDGVIANAFGLLTVNRAATISALIASDDPLTLKNASGARVFDIDSTG